MLFFKNFGPPINEELKDDLSKDIDFIVDEYKKRGEKVSREEVVKMLWVAAQDFDVESFKLKH